MITVEPVILRESEWVGKSRPVIRNVFENSGGTYVVFSTSRKLRDIPLNSRVRLSGIVKNVNSSGVVVAKQKVEVLD